MLAAKCRLRYQISFLHRIGKIRYLYVHAKSKRLIYLKGGKKVVISDYLTSVKCYNSINLYENWTSLLLIYLIVHIPSLHSLGKISYILYMVLPNDL